MEHYKAELIGTTWWVITPEPQSNGQTLISDHVSEAAAKRAANNLNEAFNKGYQNGFEDGVADVSFTIPK